MSPLIEDATTRGLVQRTVMQIASALARRDAATPVELADHAILRSYLGVDDSAGRLLADAIRELNKQGGMEPPLALDGGGARLGWTIAHLASEPVAADLCARLDHMLTAATAAAWTGSYSLMEGLVGFGAYALERGAAGQALAVRVLDHLETLAITSEHGAAWPTAKIWNLGIPNGNAGVIALLARYVAEGIEPARARVLLDGAMRFVLALPAPAPHAGRYPPVLPTAHAISTRLAWCYGDLAVASVVFGAGVRARDAGWQREGLALARACAGRTLEQAHIRDAGICHGAAGIAHMFHRMARATGDAVLATAARAWIVETLRMQTDAPLAGYPSVCEVAGELVFEPDATLLTGCAGVALVLFAAISEVEPRWDRLLLLDLPMG